MRDEQRVAFTLHLHPNLAALDAATTNIDECDDPNNRRMSWCTRYFLDTGAPILYGRTAMNMIANQKLLTQPDVIAQHNNHEDPLTGRTYDLEDYQYHRIASEQQLALMRTINPQLVGDIFNIVGVPWGTTTRHMRPTKKGVYS